MSGFFGTGTGVCRSTFYSLDGQVIKCFRQNGHADRHQGRPFQGPFIDWNDEESKGSKKQNRTKVKGPIVSWRAWKIWEIRINAEDRMEYILRSSAMSTIWHGPVMSTKMHPSGDRIKEVKWDNDKKPTHDEDCGVYSYKTPKLLLETTREFIDYHVFGRCHISIPGERVQAVEHELGYRSQKLVIQELWIFGEIFSPSISSRENHTLKLKSDLEKRYQCPVHALPRERRAAWAEFYSNPEYSSSDSLTREES